MKFLYLPNEPDDSELILTQVGPRKAFEQLHALGEITELKIFSFLSEMHRHGVDAAKLHLLQLAEQFSPDIVFWQHVETFPVDHPFVKALRHRSQCKLLVYHDPDPFDGFLKRISASMKAILSECDLAIACGVGQFTDLFRRSGARNVVYLPHCYDNIRFGHPWTPTNERKYKVTMIAGRYHMYRIPFLRLPGGHKRARLAALLSNAFGEDFALYGKGWSLEASMRGVLPFCGQEQAIRHGWISVNWDHYDHVPFYFSDRLPISLAAGVPHVTSYHPGYEQLFTGCKGLYFAKTVPEVLAITEWLLSRPKATLVEEGLQAQEWVRTHLEADVVFKQAFDFCVEALREKERNDGAH